MSLKSLIVVALMTEGIYGQAHADTTKVELGWGNITPGTKVEWRNDGIFGLPLPTK